ncbi:three-Cys-motif partner protein TcmP [Phaeobacter inhibens]|uniref:three-Cys-motif partner protein TcmP n=1 Tax=Phaeobacter inhibens TaxID=221822 RepID=UPI0002D71D18|nr:three-Cys-motif partner protein TcmP [Phaeobacter inhibens]AXT41733.1 three-Cys-motif partner protein TcmP [Phaeobacter inhibens]
MVSKPYQWVDGAVLEEHSRKKHKVLAEYFRRYLLERCKAPIHRHFRLAVVDGFAGAGVYDGGEEGSPLIFLSTLIDTVAEINVTRAAQNMPSVEVHCLFLMNDANRDAVELLKTNIAPLIYQAQQPGTGIELQIQFECGEFEAMLPTFQAAIEAKKCRNIIYNLDQCGYSQVERDTITRLLASEKSVELFYTYSIQSLLTYLSQADPESLRRNLRHLGAGIDWKMVPEGMVNKTEWLGAIERLVFDVFRRCAPFVSPFSIHNPDGWRYWFIHFANADRARQVYNDVLHDNSSEQAHFGRAGLRMLAFNPEHEKGSLYLFDQSARETARDELPDDIARLIHEGGDTLLVSDFYRSIYNQTPAHSDDIHSAIMDSADLEVVTSSGGERRKAHTIGRDDIIRLKKQMSFNLG